MKTSLLYTKIGSQLWDERPANTTIDTVVIHYISATNRAPSTPFMVEPIIDIFYEYQVSTHYLITREGELLQLVPESARAWHAGRSMMPAPDGRSEVNDFSIGIELIGSSTTNFTEEQYQTLITLLADISKRRGRVTITGHQDIAGPKTVASKIRQVAKEDPGPLFDWERVAGLGTILRDTEEPLQAHRYPTPPLLCSDS